ncbi:uncharacterized protein LOC141611778 [Silene latifolia]|uniref:uncharacterized protein LOC141611778 n=1 Tax=Silene latifolia TaxID=37657 RepID=UPI003D771BBF
MVQQRKVSNKLSIQPIQTEKRQNVTPNPSLQNYDVKIKVPDLKSKRMKKSRFIKRSEIEFNLGYPVKTRQVFQQPEEPPTLVTPSSNKPLSGNKQVFGQSGEPTTVATLTKTPSPKKPLSGNKTSPYGSPNYMKGTSSSEARKEKLSVSSTLKLQRVGKSSSFKKVRTLTKSPTFKHKKKMVLCENLEARRATCSSTLKDSKFPSYLKLTPGATEAQGTSVMKVCPYNYCSLNGHHHAVAPPLKSFLSSRRRMLKTQKNVKPGAFAPCKRKQAEAKVTTEDDSKMCFVLSGGSEISEDRKDDFFVEIHVPRHDSAEISEIDYFQDDANLSEMNFSCEEKIDEEYPSTLVHNQASFECYDDAIDQGMDSDSSVSLGQVFGEISDMEWEEGENTEVHDEKVEVPVDKANGDDEREAGFELEKFLAEKLLPYIHDEIMECLLFSDTDTVSDTESSLTEDDIEEQIVDNEIICTTELKEESIEEQDGDFSNPFEKITEASNGELDSFHEPKETNGELDEDLYICKETKDGVVMAENVSSEMEKEKEENVAVEEQIPMPDNGSQAEVELSETSNNEDASLSISAESQQPEEQYETEAKKAINETSTNSNQEQNSKVNNLHSFEDHTVQVTKLETEDSNLEKDEAAIPAIRNECQKVHKGNSGKGIESTDELFDSCNKLKRSARCKKSDEENEDAREFNPRPPNFLPVEPEQEAEKVDLRHQDMEERRNAEEWMLDHALQKTVNQLAIARKRKVALLVEAFESVLPIPKYEPQMRRDSSSFSQARRIQACR